MKGMMVMAVLAFFAAGCATEQASLCRHVVLAQYAAFVDAGYETEIWHMKNKDPEKAGGFKYHAAVRIKKDGRWLWVEQPRMVFTTTTRAPKDTMLLRKLDFDEVAGWVKKKEGRNVASTGKDSQ